MELTYFDSNTRRGKSGDNMTCFFINVIIRRANYNFWWIVVPTECSESLKNHWKPSNFILRTQHKQKIVPVDFNTMLEWLQINWKNTVGLIKSILWRNLVNKMIPCMFFSSLQQTACSTNKSSACGCIFFILKHSLHHAILTNFTLTTIQYTSNILCTFQCKY